MKKDELVEALRRGGETQASERESPDAQSQRDKEPTGDSKSVRYGQHIMSPDEERGGVPSTVPGTEHGKDLGVLRLDFPGFGGSHLEDVSWEDWFRTFDHRRLNFMYQEHKSDGKTSTFFRLDNPDREDG